MSKKTLGPEEVGMLMADVMLNSESKLNDFPQEIFPDVDFTRLKLELIALDNFGIIVGVSSFYKNDPIGIKITQAFNAGMGSILVEKGIFSDFNQYRLFMKPRIEQYDEAANNTKEPNYLYWIAKQYCENVGDVTLSGIMGITEYFTQTTIANKKLIEDLSGRISE